MEVVFCNTDYEEVLFSEDPRRIVSNLKNQQLEFFAWLLGHQTILTQRTYEKKYLDFIASLVGFYPQTVRKSEKVKTIWGTTSPLEEMRRLNSKITSTDFAIKHHLAHSSTRFSDDDFSLEEGEIAKSPFSFSGRGHLISKEKLIPNQTYIFEKRLNRQKDFSALRFLDKIIFYQNLVDDFFQYKGTIIHSENQYPHFLEKNLAEEYVEDIELITSHFDSGLQFQESYSIDSFLYEEDKKMKLYSLCEINFRSTMGKMAYLFSQKFFTQKKCHLLTISPLDKEVPFSKTGIKLSPSNNKFHLYFLAANNEEEVMNLVKELGI